MQINRRLKAAAVLAIALGLTGCFNSGVYRTARTLKKGEGDLGFSFAVTNISQTSTTVRATESGESKSDESDTSLTLPTIIPEISYHLGITDDFEFGGRVAPGSLFIELDGKYRFIGGPDEKLHVAAGLHLGYQTALIMDGPSVSIPVIATYDVSDNIAINVAAFGRVLFLDDAVEDLDVAFTGTTTTVGGHIGLELRGDTFYIMPAFEVSKWMAETETESDGQSATVDFDTTVMQGMINFGIVFGREKQQLDRMEKKIDKMDEKLDRALDK